jgi:tetratricopeptide (TPR) repeat protein
LLLWFYAFAQGLDDFQPIDRYTAEIMQLLEGCSHPILHAAAWHWIAETTPDTLQTSAASEQGIAWAREATRAPAPDNAFGLLADSDWILAGNLQNYARRLIEYGDFSQAEAFSREALMLFRSLGTDDGIGDCLSNLGRIALLRGDFEQASSFLHEVTRYNNFTPWGSYPASMMLSRIALYGGSPYEARRLLSESRQVALEREDAGLLVRSSVYLAETALWEDKLEEAERWLADSFRHYTDPRWHTIDQVERLFLAARLVTEQRRYLRAALLFGLADQLSTRINYIPAEPVRSRIDTALGTVRAALDAAVFANQFAAGQQLSLDEAFAIILNPTTAAAGR